MSNQDRAEGVEYGSIAHRLYCEIACNGEPGCLFGADEATQQKWIHGVATVLGGNQPRDAAGDKIGKGDYRDKALAWDAVCVALDQRDPGWANRGHKNGLTSAVSAILGLPATPPATPEGEA